MISSKPQIKHIDTLVQDLENENRHLNLRLRETLLIAGETSNQVLIANAAGKIEWANKAFLETTGYSLYEAIGKKPGSLLYGEGTSVQKMDAIGQAMQRGENFHGTLLNYTKAKVPYWNELSIYALKDAEGKALKFISISKDVTERVRENEQLLYNELRWKFALEESGDGYFEYDITSQKFFGSNNLLSLIGFNQSQSTLDFTSLIGILHPEDSEQAVNLMIDLVTGRTPVFRSELRLKKGTGGYTWVALRATVANRNEDGAAVTVIGTVTDITHIKETERELRQAKLLAEKESAYKNRFLATMSHEIRTPLNAIIGLTNLMLLNNPAGEQKENLGILSFSANHLLSLVNDVLDLSKIESGKMEFLNVDFNLRETVNGVYQSFISKCREKGIELLYQIESDVPAVICGDSLRLVQILNNLVNNAVKFTSQGSVSIQIKSARATDDNKVTLLFEVSDTGIGINKKVRKKIFEDFVQGDTNITQKYGGTGLGLAITKKLVDLQRGKIDFKSAPGRCTTFYFSLAFGISATTTNANIIPANDTTGNTNIKGAKVLLVEDIIVNQKVASAYLSNWGASVTCANEGKEALEIFKTEPFDIALIDLYMPVMDGFETIRRLRKTIKGRNIPIIALTASADDNTVRKAIRTGANTCISKPFDAKHLLGTIIKLMGHEKPDVVMPQRAGKYKSGKGQYKYISMKGLEAASLGNHDFVKNMIGLLQEEIPSAMQDCQVLLEKGQFHELAASVHKLKNSLLMLGFEQHKKHLSDLENLAQKAEEPDKISSLFTKIKLTWIKAEKELEKAARVSNLEAGIF